MLSVWFISDINMRFQVIVIACLLAVVSGFVASPRIQEGDDVLVTTENGVLRGVVASSYSSTLYNRFIGVRYAAPPFGDLRFKPPQPLSNWTGVCDALSYGSMCSQSTGGSEDCLFLNVYAPVSAGSSALPVSVYIHGGGFTFGKSEDRVPDQFVNKNVILVTINYRLGALGFLSLQNNDILGNAGLKDMVLALKWVQRNIAAFGGDPTHVNILGESAGGCATSHLFLSPATKGLFHAVIAESGIATATWGVDPCPRMRAYALAALLGFQANGTDDDVRLAEFLRSANHTDLSRGILQLGDLSAMGCSQSLTGVSPVIEPQSDSAVLTEMPADNIRSGRYNHVPIVVGVNSGDGNVIYLGSFLWIDVIAEAIAKNFSAALTQFLPLPTEEQRYEASQLAERFYFGDEGFTVDKMKDLVNLFTDLVFTYPADFFARAVANTSNASVHFYYFDYDGLGSTQFGMSHGGETGYLYDNGSIDPNSDDGKVQELITTLWTNVPKYSEPAPFGSPVTWKEFTRDATNYLELNLESVTRKDLLKERLSFWREILPL